MKQLSITLLMCFAIFSNLSAQTVEEIIAKAAEAMGGYDKIEQIKTISYQSIYPDHGNTPSVMEILRPNKSRNPKYELVYDGNHACFIEGYKDSKEPKPIPENELNDFVVEIALHFPAYFDYPTKLLDSVMINFKDTYHLQTSLPRNLTMDYYIDKETYLLVKASARFQMINMDVIWERYYHDYKSVEGIMFPHKFSYPGKNGEVLYADLVNVKINTIPAEKFKIPEYIFNN